MYLKIGNYSKALEAYEADLKRHAGRFNGLYGAGMAAKKLGDTAKALVYFKQLMEMASLSGSKRPEVIAAQSFLKSV
jgi:tetratricopeptide (TPR) repeat protein